MLSKFKELKEQIIESSLTVGGHVADTIITKANEIIETWGPVVWEQVARFTHQDEEQPAPPAPQPAPIHEEAAPEPEPQPEPTPVPEVEEELPLADRIENISVNTLKKRFTRNQILKILYIILRSRKEWLSPKEISDFSLEYKFKVLPGNVRKALNQKGIAQGLVLPRSRAGGRKNAKEYKITAAGKTFVENALDV